MISHRIAAIADYLSPVAAGWRDVSGEQVPLMPAPLAMQPTEYVRKSWERKPYGQIRALGVASVHDGRACAIRLSWSGVAAAGSDFPDAVALALPVRGSPALALMGAADAPIHILRWQSNREGLRSLLATGIGSSRPGPEIECGASAQADGSTWQIVVTRVLGAAEDAAPLLAGNRTRIGFAVWQGGNDERAGIKAFSIDWQDLILDA
ncbi:MAG TPA: hypothetical protein PJ986_21060 [Gammaproteobacteria bacterium]|nr:hypothetical protein [Gammaproteobacteria bacterium]